MRDTNDRKFAHFETTTKTIMIYWSVVFFGTLVAASTFGILVGGIVGAIVGPCIAAVVAIPIFVSIVTLAWALWLNPLSLFLATIAGAVTGFVATGGLLADFTSPTIFLAAATVLGGLGAGGCGYWYLKYPTGQQLANRFKQRKVRFSLKDVFTHISAIALLLAAWIWMLKLVFFAQ